MREYVTLRVSSFACFACELHCTIPFAFLFQVLEGYGQTESSGAATIGKITDTTPGLYEQGGEGGRGLGDASKGNFHDSSIPYSDPVKYSS